MRDAVNADIRSRLRAETQPQVLDRVAAILLISGIALVLALPANRDQAIWPQLAATRAIGALVQLLAALGLRWLRRADWGTAAAVAVTAFASTTLSTLAVAWIADDPLLLLLVVALTTIGTAV